ncbi:MAG: hypothetical protein IJO13_03910 [Lachnospiraceae bacterium]|nr:hypothetical protein [Lachnospiraceae bacterium]
MMTGLDVICIGAVNYDYMFHCTSFDLIETDKEGSEDLNDGLADVEADIQELALKGKEYTTQIGGSAFITLKVTKHILRDLNVAYVGACGTPSSFDLRFGKTNNLDMELEHLDNREWLFTTKERFDSPYNKAIAKSVVRLYNHSRNCIKIAPCANNTLLERIQEKEATGESFAEYLSKTRWIHLSSLSAFDQFEAIVQYVIQAKEINPNLKVSMDPGFEYTSKWRSRLQPLLRCVDYVFLNKSEKKNLGLNEARVRPLYKNICEFCSAYGENPSQTLIIKYDDRHELLSFKDGKSVIRTVRHKKLYQYQMNNDTGAGDSFAGGFIAGMLNERMGGDVAKAIQLGVLAARGRMLSFDYENPYLNIQKMTDKYFEEM